MESINFFINSKNRESGNANNSDFYYNFNYHTYESADNVLNIDSLSIPRSYYSVNDYNNVFQLDPNGLLGTTNTPKFDITLTKGDYTTTSLISEVVPKINTCGITGLSGVSMTYSSNTKKISYLGVSGVDLVTNSKQKYLGFNTAGSWTPVGGNLVSHDVVDLSGTNSINVITDIDIETYNNSNRNSNLLLSVFPR